MNVRETNSLYFISKKIHHLYRTKIDPTTTIGGLHKRTIPQKSS